MNSIPKIAGGIVNYRRYYYLSDFSRKRKPGEPYTGSFTSVCDIWHDVSENNMAQKVMNLI